MPELLAQLGLARSSYFYHRIRVGLADKYVAIRRSMTEIFETNHRCYGYRRLQASLARQSVTISEKVVNRHAKLALTHFWWSEAYPAPMTHA
ncbi:HTH-like domain-containing protein [Rhizobium sp. RU36D]|nr:HTH-like domain-containing protein [Rhizobium sp. RU36D]